MTTSLEESEKEVQIDHLRTKTYHFVKKMVTIDPVDSKLIGLWAIIKKIMHAKIYSPSDKFAERAE